MELWLRNLIIWLREALTAPFKWLHYQYATELLEAHGSFPNFANLKHLQQKYQLDINVIQIARNVNDFFRDNTLDLKDHLRDVEFVIEAEAGSICTTPEQFIARLPHYLQKDLYILIADCCACKYINHPFGERLHFATLALEDGSRELEVSVVIVDALPDFSRSTDNKITQKFPLLVTPDDLLPLINIVDLWAKGKDGIIYGIKQQCKKALNIKDTDLLSFRIGPHFVESVNKKGLATNEIVLRSIFRAASDIVADRAKDIPNYRLHPFRKNIAAESPQFVRESDRAKLWRLMIQKHGAGWRLQYWQIPAAERSIIEFANVCKETERDIP